MDKEAKKDQPEKQGIEQFTIDKIAHFEGKEVYILANAKERRMVDIEKYRNFGLKIGDRVETELKKANCAGDKITQIYHPRYKAGEVYSFIIKESGVIKIGGHEMPYVDLCDNQGFYQRIRINHDQMYCPSNQVKCRVTGMSRGKLHLLLLDNE